MAANDHLHHTDAGSAQPASSGGDSRRRMMSQATAAIVVWASLSWAMSSCGGSSIDANTKCSDFLKASIEDQDNAVSKVASDLQASAAVTPLGRPNINSICAKAPERTLGEAVKLTG